MKYAPSADGLFHFELPTGRKVALAKPRLADVKRAAQLAGSTRNAALGELLQGEELVLLLLRSVDGQPSSYESLKLAGGLDGHFDLEDITALMRAVGHMAGGDGDGAAPLGQS